MKSITLLIALSSTLLFHYGFTNAQTVFWLDDFSDTTKWVIGNFTENDVNWWIGRTQQNRDHEIRSTTYENGYAVFDADYYCNPAEAYIEPKDSIDCSNYTNVIFEFQEHYAKKGDSSSLQFTTDDWVTTEYYSLHWYVPTNYTTENPSTTTIDVSDIVGGEPNVKFAFLFYRPQSMCGHYWYLDDIKFIGTGDECLEADFIAIDQDLRRAGARIVPEDFEMVAGPSMAEQEIAFLKRLQANVGVAFDQCGSPQAVPKWVSNDQLKCALSVITRTIGSETKQVTP